MEHDELRSELRRTWAMLGPGEDSEGIVTYPVTDTRAGPLRVHVSGPGRRHLLVPGEFTGSPIEGVSLGVSGRRLVFDGTEHALLDVECRQPSLFDVFDELIVLIVERAADAGDPVDAAVTAIGDWRDLLRAGPATRLSHERELGLYAELLVLAELTAAGRFDPEWWRGPLHEAKDVVTPNAWIEVKGVGDRAETTTINGLEQLADIEGLDGYLAVVTVESDPDGTAIEDLVELLEQRTDGADLLTERLLIAGWSAASPTQRRWASTGLRLVPAADCPRLVPESLVERAPTGVERIRYGLDLQVAGALSVRDALAVLRSLAVPS